MSFQQEGRDRQRPSLRPEVCDHGLACHEASRLGFAYADGELEPDVRLAFAAHLENCPDCGRRARFVARFLDLLRFRAPRCAAPAHLRLRVLAVLPARDRQSSSRSRA